MSEAQMNVEKCQKHKISVNANSYTLKSIIGLLDKGDILWWDLAGEQMSCKTETRCGNAEACQKSVVIT